jgi:BRCT domain type II-containing protein
MKDETLLRILRKKAPFTEDQLGAMSEAEGWRWVYENKAPVKSVERICFTGFSAIECEELHAIAGDAEWLQIVTSVTSKLSYLCAGSNAGPAKVAKAKELGVTFLDRAQFEALVADGLLPE